MVFHLLSGRSNTIYILLSIISATLRLTNTQCEREPVACSDIVWSGNIWGYAANGVSIGAYTSNELQWIGCYSCSSTDFYCTQTATSMEFGTNTGKTIRALLGSGTFPTSGASCCTSSAPRTICNCLDTTASAVKLCNQLGYKTGSVVKMTSNSCPEVHWDSQTSSWTSDFEGSSGYGSNITCTTPCNPTSDPTNIPTNTPTNKPTKYPTSDPTKDPTNDPTKDPTNVPTKYPTNNPTKDPTYDPTVEPTNNPTPSPTQNPTAAPTDIPTPTPTDNPTPPTPYIAIKDNTPSPTNAEGANVEDDPTTTQTLINEKGEENRISNNTEIDWTDLHHIMFYIIIGVLLCIIVLMAILWRRSHKRISDKSMELRNVSTNPYDNVGAQSPRSEMEMGAMGNVSTFPWAINGNVVNNDMLQYKYETNAVMDTGDLPKENEEENNNQFIGNDALNTPQIAIRTDDGMSDDNISNEGNDEEEEDDGLYTDFNNGDGMTPGNKMVPPPVPDEYVQ